MAAYDTPRSWDYRLEPPLERYEPAPKVYTCTCCVAVEIREPHIEWRNDEPFCSKACADDYPQVLADEAEEAASAGK